MPRRPQLHYFACRSRGEPIRLACTLAGLEYDEWSVPEEQHNGRRQLPPPPGSGPLLQYLEGEAGRLNSKSQFPFGTCPKWVEFSEDGTTTDFHQSNAILRHIARLTSLYGSAPAEAAAVDAWLDHCEDVRKAYGDVIYGLDEPPFDDSLTDADPRVAAAYAEHAPKLAAFFQPFEARLDAAAAAAKGEAVTLVGSSYTVADVALFDIFEVHLRLWAQALDAAAFPRVHAHRMAFSALPPVEQYLSSGRRWARLNGNALG